ncbi:MAG TPA: hypothetical protein VJ999_11715 [Candidatus Sulfotelmatobacter sp.]|nr:hypothetical protein [Candidatus Sulfotelmatobacter sp.]
MSPAVCRFAPALALLGALLLGSVACTKEQPVPAPTTFPSDRVAPSPVGTNQIVLQKTFALKGTATFPFEIPAHAAQPHLHGSFQSFVREVHGASDETANIDFQVLNEEQQAAFASNRPSEALFSVEGSHNQEINCDLPASMNQPAKYYLVFRSSDGSRGSRVVEAGFRVDF